MNQRSHKKIWNIRNLYLYHMPWYKFLLLQHYCGVLQHSNYSSLVATTCSKNDWTVCQKLCWKSGIV